MSSMLFVNKHEARDGILLSVCFSEVWEDHQDYILGDPLTYCNENAFIYLSTWSEASTFSINWYFQSNKSCENGWSIFVKCMSLQFRKFKASFWINSLLPLWLLQYNSNSMSTQSYKKKQAASQFPKEVAKKVHRRWIFHAKERTVPT